MGKGGENELDDLIYASKPDLVIVDVLAKLKRQNSGNYDAEYESMSELKELKDKYDIDCLVLTHTGKPSNNDGDDPFDKIIGSTALLGVPGQPDASSKHSWSDKAAYKGSFDPFQ